MCIAVACITVNILTLVFTVRKLSMKEGIIMGLAVAGLVLHFIILWIAIDNHALFSISPTVSYVLTGGCGATVIICMINIAFKLMEDYTISHRADTKRIMETQKVPVEECANDCSQCEENCENAKCSPVKLHNHQAVAGRNMKPINVFMRKDETCFSS
jgi:hypothetical protein